jgi:hypothetical protein
MATVSTGGGIDRNAASSATAELHFGESDMDEL